MTILFIADLHLHDSRPKTTQGFYQFLHERAQGAVALYILGDFFDVWIGDDDDAPLIDEVARALRALSDQGTDVFLMHGNRDFLLGDDFAQRAGARLLNEGTVIDLYACPTLLLHGDSLCIDDVEYQAFRQQVRTPAWQKHFLAQPLETRRTIAAKARAESQSVNSMKAESIMDVTQAEVVRVMEEAGVTRLIHGHTHRPARHPLTINTTPAERIVLGDWHDYGWCVEANAHSLELKHWAL